MNDFMQKVRAFAEYERLDAQVRSFYGRKSHVVVSADEGAAFLIRRNPGLQPEDAERIALDAMKRYRPGRMRVRL